MSIYPAGLTQSSAAIANSLGPATTRASAASSTSSAGAAAGTTGTSSSAQDITSNDFLTLLVTEMKNQDPTQPTDPNAYIQQLTEVNSLQQLIAINQDLSGDSASMGSTSRAQAASSVSH